MKHLLIDMDGTIAAYSSKSGKINISEFGIGFFIDKQPVRAVLKAIYDEFPDSEYDYIIVSHSPSIEANIEKSMWLMKYFEKELKDIYYVSYPDESKVDYINELIERNKWDRNKVFLIDDDHSILRDVEKRCNIQVYHPSYILTLNQEGE